MYNHPPKHVTFKLQYIFFELTVAIIQSICSALFLGDATCLSIFLFQSRAKKRGHVAGVRDARATFLNRSLSVPAAVARRCAEGEFAGSAPRLGALRPGRASFPCAVAVVLSQKLIDRKRVPRHGHCVKRIHG